MMIYSDASPSLTGISVDLNRATREAFRGIDFRGYLMATMAELREPLPITTRTTVSPLLPARIFEKLTSAEYCYLSGARADPYKEECLRRIARDIAAQVPVRFHLEMGGGSHAALDAGEPSFDVGLGELLLLRQIRSFAARVQRHHAPGVTFTLVVDNLRAACIDGLPVMRTAAYCGRLRALIAQLDMGTIVDVLVESERITVDDFASAAGTTAAAMLSREVTGRLAPAERIGLYERVTSASERLLGRSIDGVRLAQRATPTTLCFRPFPGGDSRIQSGEVALLAPVQGGVRPLLLTSRNAKEYAHMTDTGYAFLPPAISRIIYAKPLLA